MMQATEHSIHVGVGLRPGFIRPQARFTGTAADLQVCLDPIQLQAVILFLEPDCQLLTSKRKYDKSGKFKRDANNEIEDSDVEE